MILLQTILNQIKLKDALFFHSVPLSQVQNVSIALVKAGRIRIPRDYLKFLGYSDGLSFQGIELFSCAPHERAGTVFNHPELLEYQTKYALGHFFAKRLVLGRGTEFLIAYNNDTKCYEVINRDALIVMLKFPRFEDLLYQILNGWA